MNQTTIRQVHRPWLEQKTTLLKYLESKEIIGYTRVVYILTSNHRDAKRMVLELEDEGLIRVQELDRKTAEVMSKIKKYHIALQTRRIITITDKGRRASKMMQKLASLYSKPSSKP